MERKKNTIFASVFSNCLNGTTCCSVISCFFRNKMKHKKTVIGQGNLGKEHFKKRGKVDYKAY